MQNCYRQILIAMAIVALSCEVSSAAQIAYDSAGDSVYNGYGPSDRLPTGVQSVPGSNGYQRRVRLGRWVGRSDSRRADVRRLIQPQRQRRSIRNRRHQFAANARGTCLEGSRA